MRYQNYKEHIPNFLGPWQENLPPRSLGPFKSDLYLKNFLQSIVEKAVHPITSSEEGQHQRHPETFHRATAGGLVVQKSCQQSQELKFADKSGVKYIPSNYLCENLIPVTQANSLPFVVPDVGYRQEGQQRLACRFGKRNFPQNGQIWKPLNSARWIQWIIARFIQLES